jgi:hypothetical protein
LSLARFSYNLMIFHQSTGTEAETILLPVALQCILNLVKGCIEQEIEENCCLTAVSFWLDILLQASLENCEIFLSHRMPVLRPKYCQSKAPSKPEKDI